MNNTVEFEQTITVAGDRYDIWTGSDDELYISEFCQDNVRPIPPEKEQVVRTKL